MNIINHVDYKKLLKRCMEHWIEAEGGCWDGDYAEDADLCLFEKNAVRKIYEELLPSEKSLESGKQVMPNINGKPFRCKCCGNVFTEKPPLHYICNSCGADEKGEK